MDLPSGEQISAEQFSEFDSAYKNFRETRKFKDDILQQIKDVTQSLLYVEGVTDITYIEKAAEHLNKTALLLQFKLVSAKGHDSLDKIWNAFQHGWDHQTVILLYDCDVNKKESKASKAFLRAIPAQESIIQKGIENLLSLDIIEQVIEHDLPFFDCRITPDKTDDGKKFKKHTCWSVNKKQKPNFCNWVCKEGKAADFENFSCVFDILQDCLLLSKDDKKGDKDDE